MNHVFRSKKSYSEIARETPPPRDAWRDDKLFDGKKQNFPHEEDACGETPEEEKEKNVSEDE